MALATSAGYTKVTEKAARAQAAALIDAAKDVQAGKYKSAFVMCRPPTHHAVGNPSRCTLTLGGGSQPVLPRIHYGMVLLTGTCVFFRTQSSKHVQVVINH